MPRKLFPVPPLVKRLRKGDAAVDDSLGIEEEHLREDEREHGPRRLLLIRRTAMQRLVVEDDQRAAGGGETDRVLVAAPAVVEASLLARAHLGGPQSRDSRRPAAELPPRRKEAAAPLGGRGIATLDATAGATSRAES